ncbi:hypothetical protein J7L67_07115 [bacterium]|nr:hypothetical protein [bacterium]
MRPFRILILICLINTLPLYAEKIIDLDNQAARSASLESDQPDNDTIIDDSTKYEAKQRFTPPGKPYLIKRKIVTDPVKHYQQEIRNDFDIN